MILIAALFDAFVMVLGIILLTRLVGLRSFSKMSGYDFAITVAMGSIIASVVVSRDATPMIGLTALIAVFATQYVLSRLRVGTDTVEDAMDNAPLLLMEGARMLEDNMRSARVTEADIYGKLREANVLQLSEVRAVVFEPTGDISVLHGQVEVDDVLLNGVSRGG